jgi:predicted RNA-binding Zn-ribbon protein involved in translation (DUF1610 family)
MIAPSYQRIQHLAECKKMWRTYYSLRAKYLAATITLVPGSLIVGIALERHGIVPFVVAAAVSLIGYYVFGTRLARWRCPQCGNPFASPKSLARRIPIVRRCVHCGLKAGTCP